MFAEVILPLNLKGTFTYKVPEFLQAVVKEGMRVLVPFRGRKIYTAIIHHFHEDVPETFVPKELINLLDDVPILPPQQLKFWDWLSDYYLNSPGEIYRAAFPSSLKLESETYLKLKPHAPVDFENLDVNEMYLIQALEVRQLVSLTEIEAFIPKKDIVKTINALIDLQYIEVDEHIAEKYRAKEIAYVRLKDYDDTVENFSTLVLELKKARKQQELFLLIFEKQKDRPDLPIRKSEILEEGNFAPAQLKALVDKGYVEEYFLEHDRLTAYEGSLEDLDKLSAQQTESLEQIDSAFQKGQNVLLHGVTASGKTHLYLEKIQEVVDAGGYILFLLPEISLTKQITQRLEKKYGKKLGYYHPKLSDFERVEIWKKLRNGELQIIIGTRTALFLPFASLDLIIVDEEHDAAYRPTENPPHYNAKDAAQMLAIFYGAKVILGSATPSVESYYAAKTGKLALVELQERFGNVKVPDFKIVDFKEAQDSKTNAGNFSAEALALLQQTLADKKQSMVLHNRRGYANVVECESCGHVSYCANCDVVMTYHKFSNQLKCHYCGHQAAKPARCPKCFSENLNTRGVGVEQIHEELRKIIPEAEIDRMDVDSMRRKFAYEKLYEKIENGETDIIVGTQMISKGLDFDHIEVVVVPRADQMLYIQDYRAEERAYQLLTQVAGRAGRRSGQGKILVQTINPEHPVFKLIQEQNPTAVYDYFLAERRKFNYPPFVRTIMIELKHRKEDKTERASQFMGSVLRKYLPEDCILGPEKKPIGKINLLYQYQILLKLPRGKNYAEFKNMVKISLDEFAEITAYRTVKLTVIVDP